MRYEIQRLDGRFTYRELFQYCIKFSGAMSQWQGPLEFNDTLKWFFDTYGWSAEIRQYAKMMRWVAPSAVGVAGSLRTQRPEHCNPYWSWTNGYDDLRIYVATDRELNFFQLRYPHD